MFFERKRQRRIRELIARAEEYIKKNLKETPVSVKPDTDTGAKTESGGSHVQYSLRDSYDPDRARSSMLRIVNGTDLEEALYVLENGTNMSFVDKLLYYMKKKDMNSTEVYKVALLDRRLFSKIITDRTYKPSKDTCIALALALSLSLDDAKDLLARAGYTLSHSVKRDIAIEFFFTESIYNVVEVNEILYRLGSTPLGRL